MIIDPLGGHVKNCACALLDVVECCLERVKKKIALGEPQARHVYWFFPGFFKLDKLCTAADGLAHSTIYLHCNN